MQSKRRNVIAILLMVGKPSAADAAPRRCAKEGPNGGLKRVAPQRQKLPLSACDKDLERVGGG